MILLRPKKNAIDQDGTTTQEEKMHKAKVDEEATKAKQLIDQASTNDAYTKLEIMK